ncbi:motility associated factor glycosyltransferase family protein, partial [Campylobacter sp. VTCC 70190]|uniref:motility associated factor glycosyltransferase family protein n=1 Tax=Campylobacter sp. VTCC 70190 TaxID=3392118 RepID=UPI00398E5510
NLADMITHPSYKELLLKRSSLSDTAIIVSTGPSLTKQLPLLKKYASKATIFCADSAYPILAKNEIKPDYVCMLERTDFTAEFFNHNFGEFDKDIVFILKSVVHPNAVKYLSKRNFMIASAPAGFIHYLRMDKFGYFASGFSVANMNYTLALYLGYKNIVLIGQDLAYADNGNSHPNDYQNSATFETETYEHFLTLAYGGETKVYTQMVWTYFRHNFESDIAIAKINYQANTYNCTEGGARIEGSIEKP